MASIFFQEEGTLCFPTETFTFGTFQRWMPMAEEKVTDASQKTSSQENKRQAPWVEGKTHRDTPHHFQLE